MAERDLDGRGRIDTEFDPYGAVPEVEPWAANGGGRRWRRELEDDDECEDEPPLTTGSDSTPDA